MVCYNHLLCHTPYVIHATFLLHPFTHYLYHASCYALRHVSRVTCVFNVRASSWTAKAAHSRKAEAPSYRGCPSPLRSFGAAPLKTAKATNVSKASRPLLRPLGGTSNNQATSNDSDVLNYYCVRPVCFFAKSMRV